MKIGDRVSTRYGVVIVRGYSESGGYVEAVGELAEDTSQKMYVTLGGTAGQVQAIGAPWPTPRRPRRNRGVEPAIKNG